MDAKFDSIEELYKRVYPALSIKKEELKRNGIFHIEEKDIWIYLAQKVFPYKKDLTLHDIVDEILHTDNTVLNQNANKNNRL